ncbi:hypothetical protein [Eleftheria terrae]|uniref:hypothetical protein n=1 Tax=Eleftheria terrae TaxID=1597781 RepID=UPI00263B774D|nr:hypothetical protein [Eleftheria terrae]WKB56031.1 hypothetical protein N7L95_28615 [Eleftheria terrae]
MGIASFKNDPTCTDAAEAIRLLLMPSFHPEICITFGLGKVSVVCARTMIWRHFEPSPVLTDRGEGPIRQAEFGGLLDSMTPIATSPDAVPGIIIDGMPTELLHLRAGAIALKVGGNGGKAGNFSVFIAHAIALAWDSISNAYCRNALSDAAKYVGKCLPRVSEPQRKPVVETVVLGLEEDRAQLMEALRRRYDSSN